MRLMNAPLNLAGVNWSTYFTICVSPNLLPYVFHAFVSCDHYAKKVSTTKNTIVTILNELNDMKLAQAFVCLLCYRL